MPPVPFSTMSGVGNEVNIVDNRAEILNAMGVHYSPAGSAPDGSPWVRIN